MIPILAASAQLARLAVNGYHRGKAPSEALGIVGLVLAGLTLGLHVLLWGLPTGYVVSLTMIVFLWCIVASALNRGLLPAIIGILLCLISYGVGLANILQTK